MTLAHLLAVVAGAAIVIVVLWDAFESVMVPRRIGRRFRVTGVFYMMTWRAWRELCRPVRSPSRRESWLGTYAPLSVILLLVCWATAMIIGYALLQLGAGTGTFDHHSFRGLVYLSGQTFFTLGYGDVAPSAGAGRILAVLEAGMGFGFLATVIGYLPTMYTAFSQREIEVALLDARAGSPPTAAEALRRLRVANDQAQPDALLAAWERWSAQLLETHISYPLLAYYRSQHSNQSWLSALTTMLDTSAAIMAGAEGVPREQARATFAMARHALVDVAQGFVRSAPVAWGDRLPADVLERLREHLAETPIRLPATPEYVSRLTHLRLLYEPYAEALATHLLLELPPWIHDERRRDNWRGGPWDRALGVRDATITPAEDHF